MKKLLLTFMVSVLSIFGVSQVEASNHDKEKLAVKYGCDYGNISYCDNESQFVGTDSCDRPNPDYCGNNSLTNGLESNQTTLFYMYSNDNGHFFIDPLAEVENVIFVEKYDIPQLKGKLHHGKRFIGTFVDESLWELEGLTEVIYE